MSDARLWLWWLHREADSEIDERAFEARCAARNRQSPADMTNGLVWWNTAGGRFSACAAGIRGGRPPHDR